VPGVRRTFKTKPQVFDFNPRLAAWAHSGKEGTPWNPSDSRPMRTGADENFYPRVVRADSFLAELWISGLPFTVVTGDIEYQYLASESLVMMIDDQGFMAANLQPGAHGMWEPYAMDIYTL